MAEEQSGRPQQQKKEGWALSLWTAMSRRKPLQEQRDQMNRVMRLCDLTFLGVGSTLGVGIYIIAAKEAHDNAGPAVVLALTITAVATVLAALTFVELASRVASAGSAYMYSYVACGEFPAFIIGWNLLLEYAIGTAGVARAMVQYLDELLNHSISKFLQDFLPLNVGYLSAYVDVASFLIVSLIYTVLAIGTEVSSWFTNICASVNLINIVVMVIGGALLADFHNWNLPKEEIPSDAGDGGFMPYGIEGVARAAATCFFAYVGFDTIAASGEEAINPRRNIPLSIFQTLVIVCIAYTAVAMTITLAVPYYAEDVRTPFPTAFQNAGWPALKWTVSIGALFAMSTSLLGAAYPMPRILYAMASDGMFFRTFSHIHPVNKVPHYALLLCWFVSALVALLLDLDMLIDLLSIGTLLAYAVVGVCVVQIRYRYDIINEEAKDSATKTKWSCRNLCGIIFNSSREKFPTTYSNRVVSVCQSLFLVGTILICGLMGWMRPLPWIPVGALALALILFTIIIFLQPQNTPKPDIYAVPLVPIFPYLSVLINFYFMATLDYRTWSRFLVWNACGLLIYFFYDVKYSSLSKYSQRKQAQQDADDKKDHETKSKEKAERDDKNRI